MNLGNSVVVVTGASSGIGRATAIRFAELGAKVVVNSRANQEGGEGVAEEITQSGGQAIYVQADLTSPQAVSMLFDRTVAAFGTVDILINNAGRTVGQPFSEATKELWQQVFDTNLFSAVLCSRIAAEIMMEKRSGAILNTSSIRGLSHCGREGIMAYSAAKAAVISFTKTLAKQLAPYVTVNAVAPGFVYTRAYDGMTDEAKRAFIEATALKRWIQPEEIADAFVYLASASAVTGEVLVVDGGFALKFG